MNNPLWQFSVDRYDRPGVAELCLQAQDRCGVDVNFLLYAAWLADTGYHLDAEHLAGLTQATAQWRREVVSPLRTLRRQWRGVEEAAALREKLKSLELEAERSLQDTIWHYFRSRPPAAGETDLRCNLLVVFVGQGVARDSGEKMVDSLARALGG